MITAAEKPNLPIEEKPPLWQSVLSRPVLRVWHLAVIGLFGIAFHYFSDIMMMAISDLQPAAQTLMPAIEIVGNFLPLLVIAIIWALRGEIDRQLDSLQGALRNLRDSLETASKSGETIASSAKAIDCAAAAVLVNSQRAAEALSTTTQIAANDLALATNAMRDEGETTALKLKERTEQLKDEMSRMLQEFDAKFANNRISQNQDSQTSGDGSSWESIRNIWRDTRFSVGLLIDHILDTRDGRTTRHLKLDYRNYEAIAQQLLDRGLITEKAAQAIALMDDKFNKLKNNQRTASATDVREFSAWREQLLKEYPSLLRTSANSAISETQLSLN